MKTHRDVVADAKCLAERSFSSTFEQLPENFALLSEHAPAAFAGYGLIRNSVMGEREDGAGLDFKTKELIFTLLDTLIGQTEGAKSHAAAAMRQGLSIPELVEGLTQVIMVGGITTWNKTGADVLRHALELAMPGAEKARDE